MNEEIEPANVAGSPVATANATKPLGEVIQIDQAMVQKHLGEVYQRPLKTDPVTTS